MVPSCHGRVHRKSAEIASYLGISQPSEEIQMRYCEVAFILDGGYVEV